MLTVTKTSIASETGFYISSLIKILTIIKQPLDCNCLIILFILTFLPQLLTKSLFTLKLMTLPKGGAKSYIAKQQLKGLFPARAVKQLISEPYPGSGVALRQNNN